MKKRMMLITVLAMAALLVFTGCSNNTKNNENMNENESSHNMSMDKDMSEDDMMKDDMDKDMSKEEMMTNDGDMAKGFELMDLDGNTVSLEGLEGEKVYVKFWASWCSICLAGLDELNEFSGEEHDFEVLTIVSPGYNGEKSLSKFRTWFDKQGADNLTVLIDEDGDIARKYGIRAYPTSAFIGSDGVLVHLFPGHLDGDVISKEFDKIH